jgi:7,8-dihydropterin-6-yl-methyl-4-(beta-D-ribofuranosyl)aminobenzene 5'-phosphate synthase
MLVRVLALSLAAPLAWASDAPKQVQIARVKVLSTMVADPAGLGEWGFAAVVNADGQRLLVDTGARPETVLRNAAELKVKLANITDVLLTHHHLDHTAGLLTLRRQLAKSNPAALSRVHVARGMFDPRRDRPGGPEANPMIGFRAEYETTGGRFIEHAEPAQLSPGVWVTGPVPRVHSERNWSGSRQIRGPDGRWQEDTLPEDQSLVLDTPHGLVLISGCGHAGIINTLEYARRFLRPAPVLAALGGFHLFAAPDAHLEWTAARLKQFGLRQFLGAHCTGIEATYRLRTLTGLDRQSAAVAAVGAEFDLQQGLRPGVISR